MGVRRSSRDADFGFDFFTGMFIAPGKSLPTYSLSGGASAIWAIS